MDFQIYFANLFRKNISSNNTLFNDLHKNLQIILNPWTGSTNTKICKFTNYTHMTEIIASL